MQCNLASKVENGFNEEGGTVTWLCCATIMARSLLLFYFGIVHISFLTRHILIPGWPDEGKVEKFSSILGLHFLTEDLQENDESAQTSSNPTFPGSCSLICKSEACL